MNRHRRNKRRATFGITPTPWQCQVIGSLLAASDTARAVRELRTRAAWQKIAQAPHQSLDRAHCVAPDLRDAVAGARREVGVVRLTLTFTEEAS
ncbi:hypothetical protein GCM10027418_06450 [Mariniluteicoccus endophyticus]